MSTALRRAAALAQRARVATTSSTRGTHLAQRRTYAADPNAEPKVPYPWNDPMNPSRWKEEHVVFAVLGGWGVVIFGAKSAFS
ncbi:unnamed product [Ostreococcus tauri]|uniref:Unnamed product n=1 Tax=Ostreococcus tauri TaxID=70448 RepID=A0A090M613_OSTTA|nr:unnamed product [Ostreococcus tauri]CEF98112.1 unnamed product [Ostreococcus tauri]|eukprot:XP_022839088.1 unnamed product [Ostreococcus tauri]